VNGFYALDAEWLDDGTDGHESPLGQTGYCIALRRIAQQRKKPAA
jgi:hypothetical protein